MPSMSASQAAALWGWAWGALTEYSRLFDQPGVPEAAHLLDDRQERVALVGQLVLDPRRRFRIAVPRDDALVLEDAEAFRERPRTDAGARVLELREAPRPLREVVDEPKLGRGELGAGAVDVGLHLAWVDSQLLDLDGLASLLRLRADAAPGGRLHPGDELLHRERLDEIVVGADLERVDAVVLGPARADDDDRRADPFGARRLDQAPAVEPWQHQVEHDHVGRFVAEARQPDLAAAHGDGVEASAGEVLRHPRGDHLVVLDDQDLRHCTYLIEGECGPIQGAQSRFHRRGLTRAADAARAPARADRGGEPARQRPRGFARADARGGGADGRADRRRALPQRARDRA